MHVTLTAHHVTFTTYSMWVETCYNKLFKKSSKNNRDGRIDVLAIVLDVKFSNFKTFGF